MTRNPYVFENLFGHILSPFERFLRRTTAGGIILMAMTVATLILANTRWGWIVQGLQHQPLSFQIGEWRLQLDLHHWVNDGLMSFFFLLVGLELKREILVGELSSLRDAILPVIAAFGGMIVPAALYLLLSGEGTAVRGWGIPMATDIAFSIGILVLLSWRIPKNLIIFLTALAIADDLGAVLVIALFYTQSIDLYALLCAAIVTVLLIVLNRGAIRHPLPYAFLGLLLWVWLLQSGIHATLAGIVLAFVIPARPVFTPVEFETRLKQLGEQLHKEAILREDCDHPLSCPVMAAVAESVKKAAQAVQSPQQRMEHALHPWVTFVIIPLFALNNAGIDFGEINFWESLHHPVTKGVILGLAAGKFIGISGFSLLAIKLGLCKLPGGVRMSQLAGVAWLGGIGFTMSLFISNLAFSDPVLMERAKLGILVASLVSAVIGLIWLSLAADRGRQEPGR